uniref:Raptor N-terminal CASPase-like domain-containing protein n=2 Tax=Brassica TaxID=3705 RepID=A0A0D3C2Q2_BRAOL
MAYLPQTIVLRELRHDASEASALLGTSEGIVLAPKWRLKERMKTGCVALVLCLNITVDPPDVIKISPCARIEAWIGDDEGIRETKCRDDLASIPYFDQHSLSESAPDFDLQPPAASDATAEEESYRELASVPSYVELTTEQSETVGKLALERIIESNRHVCGFDCNRRCSLFYILSLSVGVLVWYLVE